MKNKTIALKMWTLIIVAFLAVVVTSCSKGTDDPGEEPQALPLKVMSVTPADLATNVSTTSKVVVVFNKKPGSKTAQGMSFYLNEKLGNEVACDYSFDGVNTVTCTPKTPLNSSEQYKFTVKGATGDDLSTMTADYVINFTVEKLPFNVVSITPADKATGVKADAQIIIYFTKKVNIDETMKGILAVSTLNASTVCTIKYNGKDAIALVPTAAMKKDANYSVLLRGVKAADGDVLPEFKASFTTEK